MILNTKSYQKIKTWKEENPNQNSILIRGPRVTGKTTIAKMLAQEYYQNYILVDCKNAYPKEIFLDFNGDIDLFAERLKCYYHVELNPDDLIIFDDYNFAPCSNKVIELLIAQKKYHIMVVSSWPINFEGTLFKINPIDFEEFMEIMGYQELFETMESAYHEFIPLGQALYKKIDSIFRTFVIVGGIPLAVSTYLQTRDLLKVDAVKREIIAQLKADYYFNGKCDTKKTTSLINILPDQLTNSPNRFTFTRISKHAKYRDYKSCLDRLSNLEIINICSNIEDPIYYNLSREHFAIKLFFYDTGLLLSSAYSLSEISDIHQALLFLPLSKMVKTNIVAQMLSVKGELLFYTRNLRNSASDSMIIDFVIPGVKCKTIKIKLNSSLSTSDFRKFKGKFGKNVGTLILLHEDDFAIRSDIKLLPLFATCLIEE